jgi:hypothetical protein
VLVHLYPGRQAVFDAALAAHVQALPASLAVDDGLAWGAEVASEIIALRADDGSAAVVTYDYVPGAGWWVSTPPAFAPALLPNWPTVTPWTLTGNGQFRVPAPPPPSSPEYVAAFEEVKRLGSTTSTERTADQSEIARFWDDGAGTNTPPGHWNEILQTLSEQHGLSLLDNARLFALHGVVVADAAISKSSSQSSTTSTVCWSPLLSAPQAIRRRNRTNRPAERQLVGGAHPLCGVAQLQWPTRSIPSYRCYSCPMSVRRDLLRPLLEDLRRD